MSDPIELVERRLEQILKRTTDSKGIHFFLQVGGRYDERGITTLQISGSGWTLLSHRLDEEVSTFSCQLSYPYLLSLYERLYKHPFWRVRIPRRRKNAKLNEANVHLRISDQNEGICNSCQCWTTDIQTSTQLKELLRYFEQLVKILSQEQIQLDLSSTPITKKEA